MAQGAGVGGREGRRGADTAGHDEFGTMESPTVGSGLREVVCSAGREEWVGATCLRKGASGWLGNQGSFVLDKVPEVVLNDVIN
jgi:hypothetical protein